MAEPERLQERYEDALFALLMDDLAQAQGQRYREENEALKKDAAYAVPERTFQRCLKSIDRGFRKKTLRRVGRTASNLFGKFSVAVCVTVLLLTTALAASPQLREGALAFVVRLRWGHVDIITTAPEDGSYVSGRMLAAKAGWIPAGYDLTEAWESRDTATYTYENNSGGSIYVSLCGGEVVASMDTESATVSSVTVQGKQATMAEKPGYCGIAWVDEEQGCVVMVTSEQVDTATVFRFAQELEIIH